MNLLCLYIYVALEGKTTREDESREDCSAYSYVIVTLTLQTKKKK